MFVKTMSSSSVDGSLSPVSFDEGTTVAAASSAASVVPSVVSAEGETLLTKPKRPLSAYNLFFQDHRQRLLETLPSRFEDDDEKLKRSHGKIGFKDLAKTIGAKWKNITPEEKEKYESIAAEGRAKYMRVAKAWKKQQRKLASAAKRRQERDGEKQAAIAKAAASVAAAAAALPKPDPIDGAQVHWAMRASLNGSDNIPNSLTSSSTSAASKPLWLPPHPGTQRATPAGYHPTHAAAAASSFRPIPQQQPNFAATIPKPAPTHMGGMAGPSLQDAFAGRAATAVLDISNNSNPHRQQQQQNMDPFGLDDSMTLFPPSSTSLYTSPWQQSATRTTTQEVSSTSFNMEAMEVPHSSLHQPLQQQLPQQQPMAQHNVYDQTFEPLPCTFQPIETRSGQPQGQIRNLADAMGEDCVDLFVGMFGAPPAPPGSQN